MLAGKKRQQGLLGFTLVELLVVIVIIGILAGILLPGIANAIKAAKLKGCQGNLSNLFKGVFTYVALYGGTRQSPPADVNGELKGSALWVALCSDTFKDVLEQSNQGANSAILVCTVGNVTNAYEGPTNGYSKAKKYLGCDKTGNHSDGGGSALTKSGAAVSISTDAELTTVQTETDP
ncbi:MAG: hypothetical protein A2W23_01490 [Planctomycetes bacterium RBG_16_43_13]|nr:MAG: hypothetical protein A2W23_01490 [Planctomycetes bacterium RBG_16_43_13]